MLFRKPCNHSFCEGLCARFHQLTDAVYVVIVIVVVVVVVVGIG